MIINPHELRRKQIQKNGIYESRIKKTNDKKRIKKYKTNKVDIANTKFEDLPNDRKKEAIASEEIALKLVRQAYRQGVKITPERIEKMAGIIHKKWLQRNKKIYKLDDDFPNKEISYEKLPEKEKQKDRIRIYQAIEYFQKKQKS